MTRINIHNEVSNRDTLLEVPLALSETVHRIQAAIGEPDFELFGESASIYGRVANGCIELFVYGYSWEQSQAELNRIMATLTGRVLA